MEQGGEQAAGAGETKVALTDPAKELVETLLLLQEHVPYTGDKFLASKFEVNPWSREFYQILFHLMYRIDEVCRLIDTLEMEEEEIEHTVTTILQIKDAFGPHALQNAWQNSGIHAVAENRLQALRGVSFLLRRSHSYPKLSEGEINEVRALVAELLGWLREHQLVEKDFIRAALIEGLEDFDFRLNKIRWLGWSYTIESLRAVIGAYLALDHEDLNTDQNYEAMLKKCTAGLKAIFEKMRTAKDAVDIGQMILAAYGGVALVNGNVVPSVVRLLTYTP